MKRPVFLLLLLLLVLPACTLAPTTPAETPAATPAPDTRIDEALRKLDALTERVSFLEERLAIPTPTTTPATSSPSTTIPTAPATPKSSSPEEKLISWEDAAEHVGQYRIVEGTIVRTYYAQKSKGEPTHLNFHDPYQDYFNCLIWGDDRPKFPPNPEQYYLNKHVQVRGLIETYKGVPQIILYEPSQIRIAEAGEKWEKIVEEADENAQFTEVEVRVTSVIDGDTIEVEGGWLVRYVGIDTPETVHPSKPVECFGKEAAAKNRELVEGKKVRLERDVEDKDKYGRLLRYVYVDDLMVNAELVRLGYAYSVSYPPNVKYQQLFLQLERQAREQELGLWGECQ